MSNDLQYDPLLTSYLAAELDRHLAGRACNALPFFAPDRSASLWFEGRLRLQADLHPTRGWIRLLAEPGEADTALDTTCRGVAAPADERSILIHLEETGRFRSQMRTLVLELHTNQWNALLLAEDGRITAALRARTAGGRRLHPGEPYVPPSARERIGADPLPREAAYDAWMERIAAAPPEARRAELQKNFAFTGAVNAAWILGESGDEEEPNPGEAFERWWWLRGRPPPDSRILHLNGRLQPYPVRLAGLAGEPTATLLEAMERVAGAEPAAAATANPDVLRALALARERMATLERKADRLTAELSRAGEADRLRKWGDVLLAHLHEVPRGQDQVHLPDWEGGVLEIPLDPRLSPAQNAAHLYDRARRKQRAEKRIPALLAAARTDLERWVRARERLDSGVVPEWVAAIMDRKGRPPRRDSTQETDTVPYRVFRTSGGLEVRVGRGSKENDRLTFRESSPNDIWLHARSVPGSHVILRWPDSSGAPPARDLAEAAQLAALFSRARTSGVVAVDWTRRKHVRKPRGAAPGLVVPQRVKTVFVEPDASALERLRVDD